MSKINDYGLSSKDYARLYDVWKNMIDRCTNSHNDRYYTYGARGVSVCREWMENFHTFAKWALSHGWFPDLWIERKDVNGAYCPENCTFATRKEQMRNKTNNIRITIEGDEKCLAEWCEMFDMRFGTVWYRYAVGGYRDPEYLFFKGDLRTLKRMLHDRH